MFGKPKKVEDPKLDIVIDRVLSEMVTYGPDSEDYATNLSYLERLNEMKPKPLPTRVSPDQMALVAGNLLCVLIIVAYEQKHVMVSKARDFIIKK